MGGGAAVPGVELVLELVRVEAGPESVLHLEAGPRLRWERQQVPGLGTLCKQEAGSA